MAAKSPRPRPERSDRRLAVDASPRIAIDAMGGDTGPAAMVAGMARARRKNAGLRFELFGDEALIAPALGRHHGLKDAVTVNHTTDAIDASEKPSQAIRRARTTSMGMAINAVREARAAAVL